MLAAREVCPEKSTTILRLRMAYVPAKSCWKVTSWSPKTTSVSGRTVCFRVSLTTQYIQNHFLPVIPAVVCERPGDTRRGQGCLARTVFAGDSDQRFHQSRTERLCNTVGNQCFHTSHITFWSGAEAHIRECRVDFAFFRVAFVVLGFPSQLLRPVKAGCTYFGAFSVSSKTVPRTIFYRTWQHPNCRFQPMTAVRRVVQTNLSRVSGPQFTRDDIVSEANASCHYFCVCKRRRPPSCWKKHAVGFDRSSVCRLLPLGVRGLPQQVSQ